MFVSPVKGQITQKFDPPNNHFALDILVDIGTPVKSILEGKVIFSEWSVDTGYVLIINHGRYYFRIQTQFKSSKNAK